MSERYSKKENEILRQKYSTATITEILKLIPNRSWVAIAAHASRSLGLLRTRKAKGIQIQIGMKRNELGNVKK